MTQLTRPKSSAWFERTRELTLQMVRWPSLTSTAGETDFAHHLHGLLAQWPYFQAHPDQLRLELTSNDAVERYCLFALVRGAGTRGAGTREDARRGDAWREDA